MSLVDLNPAGLNLASLKPYTPEADAQQAAAKTQQQLAQVQLTNAQNEQQRDSAFRTSLAVAAKAPSVDSYTQLLAGAPREYVEGIKASISQMDAAQKKTLANQILQPWLAGVNGRPDLQKDEMEKLAAGYESKGMPDKAAGIRDLLAKADAAGDPNLITGTLNAMYVEAVGVEKFKALGDSLGWNSDRRKKAADALAAEGNADPQYILGKKREQLAKAKEAEAQADNADVRERARARAQVLEAEIKEIEKPLVEPKARSLMESQDASAYRDRKAGDRSAFQTEEDALTQGDRLAKAAAENRTAQAAATVAEEGATPGALAAKRAKAEADNRIAQAGATVAEAGATKEALAAKQEQEKEQTRNFKMQASAAEAAAKALPAHVGDSILKGSDAAREIMAGAVRARTAAAGYHRVVASGGGEKGTAGKLRAWAREVAGTQNKRDELNQLADRVLNSEIITEAQKIRPVSNEDAAMLRRSLPDPRGNPKIVADFMDALARVQESAASVKIDGTAWQAAFRGPNNADRDTSINGVKVKEGETYDGFLRRAVEVREALAVVRDPKTDPALAARIRAKLAADGEIVNGR